MPSRPNVIIVLCDDLGYGDLSCYGHPVIHTPNLDRLASEGQRWTNFYASSPLCNPSRTALMTGRLPIRVHGGLGKWADLPHSELTIADMLKEEGYNTCYIGKWGLCRNFSEGGRHPNDVGFDYYYGLVGSNDAPLREGFKRTYENIKNATSEDFPISLYRQREAIETPAYQPTLTKRYAEESVNWIKEQSENDNPFFLYLGHTMPHVPIFCSPEFEGHSKAGLYGDVVEEIDWSVGQIVSALEETGVADDTLIIFSSDNGPWLTYYDLGGTPGPWRDGKITSWEGGFRVPGIFWWPNGIQPGVIQDMGVNVDLIATIASITGANLPQDRSYDALDLSQTLLNGSPSPRTEWMFYGHSGNLWSARVGDHKLVYESIDSVDIEERGDWRGYGNHTTHDPPLLFDLTTDIKERRDIAAEYPEIVAEIEQAIEQHQQTLPA